MTVGSALVRIVLLAIVVVWTIPTFGLFISSLRDKDQLSQTGWWEALRSVENAERGRISNVEDQVEQDGTYILEGNLFDDGHGKDISTFGMRSADLEAYQAGESVDLESGQTLTLEADGAYRLESSEPFEDLNVLVYYIAETPPRFTLENYEEVLDAEDIGQSFLNTLTVTVPATVIPIAIAAFAAYAFSWMAFPGRKLLFAIVVGLQVVPLQMSLIPLLKIYNQIGIAKTYPGIWLAHTGFGLPLAIFLIGSYISTLPRELIESAKLDGATHFQVFTRLVIPLSVPALASFATFQFLWVWNDLLVALVFLGKRPDQIVLTSKMRELIGSRGDNWEILTSSAFISIIVPVIVFFALQRYFVRGLMAGSIKGG
jgi:alpha-glucoside transport system permease protein